jgi:hypothetical protein
VGLSRGNIVKSAPVSLRDHASNILDNLIASGIYSAAILIVIKFWPRILVIFAVLRVAVDTVLALPKLLLHRLRARPLSHDTLIIPPAGSLAFNEPAEPMPPGTASALAMAMQPPVVSSHMPSPMPAFVNNSNWMQWEHVQREQEIGARIAMQSTMPKFNPAVLSLP